MLTTIILIAIIASLIYAGCHVRNYYLRANKPKETPVKPLFPPYKPPVLHTVYWALCWVLVIVVFSGCWVVVLNNI